MSVIIKSGDSTNTAVVNSDGELLIAPNQDITKVGLVAIAARPDDGTVTGSQLVRELDMNDDYAARIAIENLLFIENFTGTAINTGTWNQSSSTMAIGVTGGFLALNSSVSTNINTYAIVNTYRTIPLYGSNTTYIQFRLKAEGTASTNKTIEFGLGFVATNATPTDGVFIRWDSTGAWKGIINNNGAETPTTLGGSYADDDVASFIISISQQRVEFWKNNVLLGSIDCPATLDSPTRAGALPLFARCYNAGTIPATAPYLGISEIQVFSSGADFKRTFGEQMSLCGNNANNGATGFSTLGTQSNMSNSLALTSGTLTNTAAPSAGYTGTTLGGEFQFAALASANTDLIIFGYQVPAASATTQARNLVVTGIRINTVNTGAAVATTATIIAWSLGFGSTNISLATAEAAGAKAPRRVPLGIQGFLVGDAIGQQRDPISVQFQTPIVVYPGQFLHVVAKVFLGTATGSEVFRGMVGIDGYWE